MTSKNFRLLAALIPLTSFLPIASEAAPPPAAIAEPAPFPPLPNPAQLRWHEADQIMFIHWGMKTFHPSGNHMGSGEEDPKTFNPKNLDVAQWVRVAKESGFKGIVFTTKHHDGFCSWRTATTDHSVKSSPWKNGQGDVVRELADACHKAGIYFGLYVSIKDNHYEAKVSKDYEGYADYYYKQLEELSTNYGRVDEYWFDGYSADKVKVDYAKIAALIKKEQPHAVIYDSHTLAKYLPDRCLNWPGNHGGVSGDQEYVRQIPGAPKGTVGWYPNEPSLILQGNWFYVGGKAVGVETMKSYYMQSTARSVTPLMNIAPTPEGVIEEDAIAKLKKYKAWVDGIHASDLARLPGAKTTGSKARGDDKRFAPASATDGDAKSYYAPEDDARTATIEVTFDQPHKVGGFIMQEPIALGQRVKKYVVECRVDGKWVPVFAGKTIGHKRIVLEGSDQVPDLAFAEGDVGTDKDADKALKEATQKARGKTSFPVAEAVRLRILEAGAAPLISNFQIVGEIPENEKGWKVTSSTIETKGGEAKNAIDGDAGSLWHTHGKDGESGLPQSLTVDMGTVKTLKGFTYTPRQDGIAHGMVDQYTFEVSLDGKTWTKTTEGEFANLRAKPIEQSIPFKTTKARYFKFIAKHALEKNHAAIAEIGVIE